MAKHVRSHTKLNNTLLVALTGYASKQDQLLAKQSGFDLHVAKPFKIETIEQILARYMDAKG